MKHQDGDGGQIEYELPPDPPSTGFRLERVNAEPVFFATCFAWDCARGPGNAQHPSRRMCSAEETIYADLNGPAYRAYYCVACAAARGLFKEKKGGI